MSRAPFDDARLTLAEPSSSSSRAAGRNTGDRDATPPPPPPAPARPNMLIHLGRNPMWTVCGGLRSALVATDDPDLLARVKRGEIGGGRREVCPVCDPAGCGWRAFGCSGVAAHLVTIEGRDKPVRMCVRCASLFDPTVGGTTATGAVIPALCSDDFISRAPLASEPEPATSDRPTDIDAPGGGR